MYGAAALVRPDVQTGRVRGPATKERRHRAARTCATGAEGVKLTYGGAGCAAGSACRSDCDCLLLKPPGSGVTLGTSSARSIRNLSAFSTCSMVPAK